MTRWGVWCVGVPGALAMAGLAAWLAASWLGLPPTGAGNGITLSEAAALADHADVVRLISRGADPNAPARVRAGTLDLAAHVLSPLEAATYSRQSGVMELLVDSGAAMTPATYPRVRCLAGRVPGNSAVVAFLDAHRPVGLPQDWDTTGCAH